MNDMKTPSACACMGAVYGEPYCPCEMRQRGLCSSEKHEEAMKKAKEDMARVFFGPGGIFAAKE